MELAIRPLRQTAVEEEDAHYTARDAATANSVLRAALGLAPERFATEQFVGMISDEIEQLRRAGRSDADIARILHDDGGITLGADAIACFYAEPNSRHAP